jgi:uncharacterized OB-fold protein
MHMIESMPMPTTDDPTDAAFWQAALRSELVVQQCDSCGGYRFPPRPMCPRCQSMELHWQAMSGRGAIWSFAAPSPPLLPAFQGLLPYVTAVIELAEDPALRMVGALIKPGADSIQGIAADTVRIGMPVRVAFWRCAEDVALPCWTVAPSQSEEPLP